MKPTQLVILQNDGQWLLSRDSKPHALESLAIEDATNDELVARIKQAANLPDGVEARVAVLPSAQQILASSFVSKDADRKRLRELAFEFEVKIPLAAELFTADFLVDDDHVFGVCVADEFWERLVLAFEASGLRVQTVTPAAVLALQTLLAESKVGETPSTLVLWEDEQSSELFRLEFGRLRDWHHLRNDPAGILRSVRAASREDDALPIALIGVSNVVAQRLSALENLAVHVIETEDRNLNATAAETAHKVLNRGLTPWLELRRGKLAAGDPLRAIGRSLQWLYVAAALFLLCVTGACLIRGWQFDAATARIERDQQSAYQRVFAGPAPSAVLSRLRSEKRKLLGAHGGADQLQLPPSGLRLLHEALTALPRQDRFLVQEIRIESGELILDVSMLSHGSVNVLVEALERQGFAVQAPATTRQSPDEVTSRIFAQFVDPRETPTEDRSNETALAPSNSSAKET